MKVLIAVDESPESREAAVVARRTFHDEAEYSVLSVGQRIPVYIGGYGAAGVPLAGDLERELHAARDASEHAVEEAAEALRPDCDVETDVGTGHAGRVICEFAQEHDIDIIVIGSHDRSFWERIIDPSVGRYLIEHAPCPVLVVR